MAAGFDPYHRWLSIPPSEQPPNHYRLLGLQAFESSVEVIENAAARQATHVRQQLQSPLRPYAVNLLREIEVARLCLGDVETRTGYDAWLRTRIPAGDSRATAAASQSASATVPATAEISWPPAGQSTSQEGRGPAIVTSYRLRRTRRKRSPIAFLFFWVVGGVVGLLAGYAILCMIDPQYDFLKLVFKDDRVAIEGANSQPGLPNTNAAPTQQPKSRKEPIGGRISVESPRRAANTPQRNIAVTKAASDMKGELPKAAGMIGGEAPKDAPIQADRKPVNLPFDLKKRVLRVVASPAEPVPQNILCDVHGSGELRFAPLLNLALGEKQTVLFQSYVQDLTVGAEIEFLQRNDLVVLEVRPKYRLPSGDEEALYKSAGLRKVKLVSNQVAMASSAQQALPNLNVALERIRAEYQAVLPTANSATTGMGYMRITAAQLRIGTLQKQGSALEDQIRDAEAMVAKLPRLQSDLAAVRGLGEWSARIATTATLSVSIHAEGVGIRAEAR